MTTEYDVMEGADVVASVVTSSARSREPRRRIQGRGVDAAGLLVGYDLH